jgi:hypothetical protein
VSSSKPKTLIRLTVELTDDRIASVLRTLDTLTLDRSEQYYLVKNVMECLRIVSFPDFLCDTNSGEVRKSSLALSDIP